MRQEDLDEAVDVIRVGEQMKRGVIHQLQHLLVRDLTRGEQPDGHYRRTI